MRARRLGPILLLVLPLLAGCASDAPGRPEADVEVAPPVEAPLRFLVIGDQGTGEADQFRVAEAMAAVCVARGCDFVLGTGDNIYESGVSGPDDPQFAAKFEEPYAAVALPFYLSLGNHDNGYDPALGGTGAAGGLGHWWDAGNHQVAYAQRTDRPSEMWQMPARYYAFEQGPATFLALDTNTFVYRGVTAPPSEELLGAQEAWVAQAVAQARTPWVFAFGHHPYVSNGVHGDAGAYDFGAGHPLDGADYRRFVEANLCGKVDVLFSGHDHDLQWLEPVPACGETQFVVSGAASQPRQLGDPDRHAARFQAGGTLGFAWVEAAEDRLRVAFFDGDGAPLFEDALERTRGA